MISDELKGISVLLDSTIKDVKEWEKRGCPKWAGDTQHRVGGTATGIKESCKMIRRMMLQISREVEEHE